MGRRRFLGALAKAPKRNFLKHTKRIGYYSDPFSVLLIKKV